MDRIFAKTLKRDFLSPPYETHLNFLSKTGMRHFSCFMMCNFMGKNRKMQANWKTNKAKL